jgi:PhzF family phenazine biosynthesis protein
MKQKIYQIDTFTDRVFSGNPAAICPLEEWLSDDLMQKIAMENNLAETAFLVQNGERYDIRWFTPTVEVDLCGHATLASAFVLFNYENYPGESIYFHSPRSGALMVRKDGDVLTLNFPADVYVPVEVSEEIKSGFSIAPTAAFKGKTDYMLLFKNENEIKTLAPHLDAIAKLPVRGVIVTARGDSADFVSRFFAPQSGINEDPVTGSAHTTLIPYWAEQLHKTELTAIQLSKRVGHLQCRFLKDRVEISGECRLYLRGEIFVE